MQDGTKNLEGNNVQGARGKNRKANNVARACKKQKGGQQLSMLCQLYTQFVDISLPHQAGIELSDFHARGWKSDQGGRNSMQEMHGNQTKCMEFQPIKKSSNF